MKKVTILIILIAAFGIEAQASGNKAVSTQALINAWSEQIHVYQKNCGHFPSNNSGLLELCKKADCSKYPSPTDSWHNKLIYIYPSLYGDKIFDLYSVGENGINEFGKGDDISNWSQSNLDYYSERSKKSFFKKTLIISTLFILFALSVTGFKKRTKR